MIGLALLLLVQDAGAVDATPEVGTAVIDVTPADAVIQLEDKTATGHWDGALEPGVHRFVLRRAGYKPRVLDLPVTGGQTIRARVVLEALMGRLFLQADRPGAVVVVDGVPRGSPGPSGLRLGEGSHEVRVEATGAAPWNGTLSVLPSHDYYMDVEFGAQPSHVQRTTSWALIIGGGATATVGSILLLADAPSGPDPHYNLAGAILLASGVGVAIIGVILHHLTDSPTRARLRAVTP